MSEVSLPNSAETAGPGVGLVVWVFILLGAIASYRAYSRRNLNRCYLRDHYGDDIDTVTKTYIGLIKHHSLCTKREVRVETENVKVILIGANEEAESRVRNQRSQAGIDDLLFVDRRFAYPTITAAMQAANEYCKPLSESKPTQTLFVFLLISSRDPALFGPQSHEAFRVPGSLRYHHYAIVGTGTHGNVAAHKLCKSSMGPNKERLQWNLPMGLEKAGVVFCKWCGCLTSV